MKTTNILQVVLLALFINAENVIAQITGPEQDCVGAKKICSDAQLQITEVYSYIGDGQVEDLLSLTTCIANGENNSVWYFFEIDSPGLVVFTLTPYGNDDYDFSVYLMDSTKTCTNLLDTNFSPLRCSYYAYAPPAQDTFETGLRLGYTDTISRVTGSPFLAPLYANTGEKYYLLVDNFGGIGSADGYTLDFTGTTAKFNYDSTIISTPSEIVGFDYNFLKNISISFNTPFDCSILSNSVSDYAITGPSNIILDSMALRCNGPNNTTAALSFFYNGAFMDDSTYYFHMIPYSHLMTLNPLFACTNSFIISDSIYSFVTQVFPMDSFGFVIFGVPPSQTDNTFAYEVYTDPVSDYILTFSDPDYVLDTANRLIQFSTSGTKEVCAIAWNQLYADTICKTVEVVLGIDDKQLSNQIMLSPNPAKDKLNITTALKNNCVLQYQIINTLGAKAMASKATAKDFSIDVSALPTGIYFIHLQSGNAQSVKRFVKE